MRLRKHTICQLLKIGMAIALIAVVISEVSFKSLVMLLKRAAIPWFALSILAFYVVLWSMARRYWIIIGKTIEFHELLKIVVYQNIVGNLLTTAAGAAWYVGSLSNKHKIQVTKGLLSLLLARFGDLLTLLLTLSLATLVLWRQIPTLHVIVTVVIFLLIVVALLSLLMFILRRQLIEIADRVVAKFNLHKKVVVQRSFAALTAFADQEIDRSGRSIGALTGYSVLTLGTMLLFAYCSLRIFGVQIDIWPVLFVVSLTQIMTLFPIQVLGGLGLHDISYLYLYGLFGIDHAEFAAVVVGLRITFYLTNLVFLVFIILARGLVTRLLFKKEMA